MHIIAKAILIVDDNFEDLQEMKKILEDADYKVSIATNGAQAFDAMSIKKFDIILVDIQMPVLSGYDLANLLSNRRKKDAVIIFVSILLRKEVNLNLVDGFIQKPFSRVSLLAGIHSAVKNHQKRCKK